MVVEAPVPHRERDAALAVVDLTGHIHRAPPSVPAGSQGDLFLIGETRQDEGHHVCVAGHWMLLPRVHGSLR